MPIRGDRLRWPPRPGKKSSEGAGTRRTQSTTPDDTGLMQRPDERDESAEHHVGAPRDVIKQAHDDLEEGQRDTDCRNRTAEGIKRKSSARPKP